MVQLLYRISHAPRIQHVIVVSPVVETEYGFHIIQMIEKKGNMMNFRHILMKPKVSMEALEAADKKANEVYNILKSDTISFIDALVSILTLQNTLISVNSTEFDRSMFVLAAATSAVIFIAIMVISVISLRKSILRYLANNADQLN